MPWVPRGPPLPPASFTVFASIGARARSRQCGSAGAGSGPGASPGPGKGLHTAQVGKPRQEPSSGSKRHWGRAQAADGSLRHPRPWPDWSSWVLLPRPSSPAPCWPRAKPPSPSARVTNEHPAPGHIPSPWWGSSGLQPPGSGEQEGSAPDGGEGTHPAPPAISPCAVLWHIWLQALSQSGNHSSGGR